MRSFNQGHFFRNSQKNAYGNKVQASICKENIIGLGVSHNKMTSEYFTWRSEL